MVEKEVPKPSTDVVNRRDNLSLVLTVIGSTRAETVKQRIQRIAPQITEVAICASVSHLRNLTRFNDYQAVLIDWQSGHGSLDLVAQAVRACPLIPVLVISREPESQISEQMLRLGAQDYLVKRGTRGPDLVRAILHAIDRKGLDVHLKTTLGELGQANARLKSLALRDTLTGALNRRAFTTIAEQMIARARRHQRHLAVLYCDLDGFKQINDRLGHDVGDAVLKAFCQRAGATLRRGDCLARLGGDEFVILLDEVPEAAYAGEAAARLQRAFDSPLAIGGQQVSLGLSIGIALFPECASVDDLIQRADKAMYAAKRGAGEPANEVTPL